MKVLGRRSRAGEILRMISVVAGLALGSMLLVTVAVAADEEPAEVAAADVQMTDTTEVEEAPAAEEPAVSLEDLKAKQGEIEQLVTLLEKQSVLQNQKSELSRQRSDSRRAYEAKLEELTQADPEGAKIMADMQELETQLQAVEGQRREIRDRQKQLRNVMENVQAQLEDEELSTLRSTYEQAEEAYAAKKDEIRTVEQALRGEDEDQPSAVLRILSDLHSYVANL